jgi:T4 RnlA family RNA ligase
MDNLNNLETFSLQDALQLVEENPTFYYKTEIVNNTEVYIFNYRLSDYNSFSKNPLLLELRGLSFFEDNGPKKHLMLGKFFNINENISTQYDMLKDKKVKFVQEKFDGSMITFVKIKGKYFAKTKGTFYSEQAALAQTLLTQAMIDMFDSYLGYSFIFELISPLNKIVVDYPNTKLVLLQIRNQKGEYLDPSYSGYPLVSYFYQEDLKWLIEKAKILEGKEGWVVTFEDNQKIKIKTEWYFKLHHLVTDVIQRENDLISLILDDKTDDLLSNISNIELQDNIKNIQSKIYSYFMNNLVAFDNILQEAPRQSKKEFALYLKQFDNMVFTCCIKCYEQQESLSDNLKEYIKKATSSLQDARLFLANL